MSALDIDEIENDYNAGEVFVLGSIPDLIREIRKQRIHLDKFCKCPSHGPSLIQIPDGEFGE